MNSHLNYAVAQSRRQDMLRQARQAQAAADALTEARGPRFRLTMPRLRLAVPPAGAQTARPVASPSRIAGI